MIELNPPDVITELESIEEIVGIGVDLVDTNRFDQEQNPLADRSQERMFTPRELDTANSRLHPEQFLAGRFAIKEAVVKALPTSNISLLDISDIEVDPRADGAPSVRLPSSISREYNILASISHEANFAIGFAVAVDSCVIRPEAE